MLNMRSALCTLVLSASLLGATVPTAHADFVHPGILMNENHFQRLWLLETDLANPDTRKAFYRQVAAYAKAYPDNNANYQSRAMAHVPIKPGAATPEKTLFNEDMYIAYYNAVRWSKTGNPEYRDIAIRIMNAWATTFKSFTSDGVGKENSQIQLVAAWAVPIWANTAEIIRHYKPKYGKHGQTHHANRPWTEPEIATFTQFLVTMHRQIGHGPKFLNNARHRNNNWGSSAALADMSLGVFTDNANLYQKGLTRMRQLIPTLITPTGEVYELRGRDCAHPQYTLIGFTQAAQIEINQGSFSLRDLSREGDRPLLWKSIEYMSRAITEGSPARDCTRDVLRDGYGPMALRIYKMGQGMIMPDLEKAMKKAPAQRTYLFTNFTDITHGGNTLDNK